MISFYRIFTILTLCGLLAACSAFNAPLVTDTPLVPTPIPSATIDWFPTTPTTTPTAFATYTAAPDMHPGLGDTLLNDSFDSESPWDTATSDQGGASIAQNRLTLAVQPGVYLISLRHDLNLRNFYAEITASPNLCRGNDDYGLLIRANAVAYYRFALSCNGTVAAERVSVNTRQPLQKPAPSSDAPTGAPGTVRIGVWVSGTEMRLFLNDHYQFTVNDANYKSGTIGVYVRSAGNTPAAVSFSDLTIQEVTVSPPTQTPLP
ncbi:MAG TPA: hypothetical protein VMT73_09460 [Anaerolineales bacterium]|nr:hypothetical protein [Anaerolineales bacterium]